MRDDWRLNHEWHENGRKAQKSCACSCYVEKKVSILVGAILVCSAHLCYNVKALRFSAGLSYDYDGGRHSCLLGI